MLPNVYNDDLLQDFTVEIQPTRTYCLNFSGGRAPFVTSMLVTPTATGSQALKL